MKLRKCAFQIDQFQGRPSPKNALAVASKNRRRFASRAICLPKSLEAARLLRTVRTSRLGRQSAASSGDAVSRLSLTVTSGDEAGRGADRQGLGLDHDPQPEPPECFCDPKHVAKIAETEALSLPRRVPLRPPK